MNQRVINLLNQYTLLENEQKKIQTFQDDLPSQSIDHGESTKEVRVLNNYFFRNRNIYISKHNRFAPYPMHTHQFIEFNYMLRGSCHQIVAGKPLTLHTGDLLLIDEGCAHAIGTLSDNDLLINILFRDQNISIKFLNSMRRSNSILYDFLLRRSAGEQTKINYLLFPQENGHDIQDTLEKIIEEYFLHREFSDTIIKSYLSVLFAKLVRNYRIPAQQKDAHQQLIVSLLTEISSYYQTINLQQLSKQYGYNKNYLSNLIKKNTGRTFSELVTQQRLIQAHTLVTSTSLPITEIMHKVGINNKNFFYEKYKNYYLVTPGEDRKANK